MSEAIKNIQISKLNRALRTLPFFKWANRPLGFHFWEIDLMGYFESYPSFIGMRFGYVLIVSEGAHEIMYRNKKQQEEFISKLQKKSRNINFLERNERKIAQAYHSVWTMAAYLRRVDWTKKTNAKLARAYADYYRQYSAWIAAPSSGILVSEAIAQQLRILLSQLMRGSSPAEIESALRILSTPEKLSMVSQEELEFSSIQCERTKSVRERRLVHHAQQWAYIPVYAGYPAWSIEDFRNRLHQRTVQEARQHYQELSRHTQISRTARRELLHRMPRSQDVRTLSKLLRRYLYWRISDETTMGLITHSRSAMFTEIAKRLAISPKQLLHMTGGEVVACLRGLTVDLDLINQRLKRFAIVMHPKGVAVVSGAQVERILHGVTLTASQRKTANRRTFSGTPARPGTARGRVRIILDPGKIESLQKGNILVTTTTTPAYVVGMKRAAAIVTEEGGITSHAAIVSRELGIPCIIGVAGSTTLLKDGDEVEVDANNGTVTKL